MSYNNVPGAGPANSGAYGGTVPNQPSADEIAYWTSLGYVYDSGATAAQSGPELAYSQNQPTHAYGAPVSIQPSANMYSTGSRNVVYYPNGPQTGGMAGGPNAYSQHPYPNNNNGVYEDYNKLFTDPKKVKEDIAAAEAEEPAEKVPGTAIRSAAGQTWEDSKILDFDENDFRLFAGDLGNEVTDEILAKPFSKYPSFQMARVIRDKRTQKTKGYGFVSFSVAEDFARAWKEMDGKYVGNRPIKLRKSQWKDRNIDIVKDSKPGRGSHSHDSALKKDRAKPYKIKKLNNAGK
ncbi:hypothetical protein BGW38_007235 [Lunasporangiospora selenospora]|uniref:RRM domain-containing protein n=1 Tax=Lunasporangiospora selenospora TaxID=979761 RepID=A0A9P6FL89_9FUNG|nr:hypothetical protein BGW38_007235 [Lunasporangiospora selenospora]